MTTEPASFELAVGARKTVIGTLHVPPLPGTPFHDAGSFGAVVDRVVRSAEALYEGGADGCLVQTADRVYPVADECDPARAAAVALLVSAIRRAVGDGLAVGVQIMRNAARASLGVAAVADGRFVRVTALVGETASPQGRVVADPLAVAQYRRQVGADHVALIADVASMHFKWSDGGGVGRITAHAVRAGADAVCLGHPDARRTIEEIDEVRRAEPSTPVILAGYTNHDNVASLAVHADGMFVGRCLERDGWGGVICAERVGTYVQQVRALQ